MLFRSILEFLRTVDRIEAELDEIRIAESTLTNLIDFSTYFHEEYVDQLEDLRDVAGACIALACQAANIRGLQHWTDNHPDPLATNYENFQRQYVQFLTGICQTVKELEAQAGEELTEQDLVALYGLTVHLSSPLMLTKAYANPQTSPGSR